MINASSQKATDSEAIASNSKAVSVIFCAFFLLYHFVGEHRNK